MTQGELPQDHAIFIFCKISFFFNQQLHLASALVLVAMATSRLVKATSYGVTGTCAGKCLRAITQSRCWNWVRGVSTVRGAKVACVVAFFVSVVFAWPNLFILIPYHSPAEARNDTGLAISSPTYTDSTLAANLSGGATPRFPKTRPPATVGMTSTEETVSHTGADLIPWSTVGEPTALTSKEATEVESKCVRPSPICPLIVNPDYATVGLVVYVINFLTFIVTVLVLVIIYGAILQQRRRVDLQQQLSSDLNESAMPMPPVTARLTGRDDLPRLTGGHDPSRLVSSDDTTPVNDGGDAASDKIDKSGDKEDDREPKQLTKTSATTSTAAIPITTTTAPRNNDKRERGKTTVIFLLVTVIFVASYLPYLITAVWGEVGGVDKQDPAARAVLEMLKRSYLLANALNPFVYGFCNPLFRQQLKNVFRCRVEYI